MDLSIFKTLIDNFKIFAILKVAPQSPDLKNLYKEHIKKHNSEIFSNRPFSNSGFDLLVPEDVTVVPKMKTQMLNMNIKCEMEYMGTDPCGYFMFPRSSISKTPLMLANHTGIIDAGYRGSVIGAFRNTDSKTGFQVEKNTRLLQICHPSLCPIYVILVDESELSNTTRGEGGFGSTGK
jgi:dUTP pyrophosphatase